MKVFCSGIGGIGLSAYASHMRALGHDVSGTDKNDSDILENLRSQGVTITLKQDGSAVTKDLDLFVYSEAVPPESPERVKAVELGIRQISYFAALGELTAGTDLIAICGTHGKSSTTAMTAKVFIDAGLDPNVVVGTKTADLGGKNWRKGSGKLWIVEACEYRRSFLYLKPTTILVTNADGDHFDSFKNIEDYENAFVEFLSSLPEKGSVIGHGQDEKTMNIAKRSKKTLINADTQALPTLTVPGVHMQKNAQLVSRLAELRGLDPTKTAQSLLQFSGSWRRMEVKGEMQRGVTVIDDYAHHPVEIRATIAAIREKYKGRRLVCVFEPHTNHRTLTLWKEFTLSFTEADLVLVTKVFDARPDKDSEQADVAKFAAEIGKTSKVSCRPSGTIERTKATLDTLLQSGDVLLVMGAGNSTKIATALALL